MKSDWKQITLGEIYDFSSGLSKSAKEFGFGSPFLSFKTVFDNCYVPDKIIELANTTEKEQERYSIKAGDAFLTRTSETINELGMSCVALKNYPGATFNGFTKRLRPKKRGEVYPLYAAYYFRSSVFRSYINSMATMTTRASLNNDMLARLLMILPSYREQIIIGDMLYAFDKKISNNQIINRNLSEMAQTIFKDWFVDFCPYKNGIFEDSDLGLIPSGWKVMKLGDVCTKITDGSHYSPKGNMQGTHPMLSVKDMTTYGFNYSNCKMIDDKEFHKMQVSDCVPQVDDILIAKDGSYLKEIFITNEDKEEAILSSIAIFRPNKNILHPELLLNLLKQSHIKQEVKDNFVSGSALPRIVLKDFKQLKIIVPSHEAQEQVIKVYRSIRNQIDANCKENRVTKEVKDKLLPKLMSGEIQVPI